MNRPPEVDIVAAFEDDEGYRLWVAIPGGRARVDIPKDAFTDRALLHGYARWETDLFENAGQRESRVVPYFEDWIERCLCDLLAEVWDYWSVAEFADEATGELKRGYEPEDLPCDAPDVYFAAASRKVPGTTPRPDLVRTFRLPAAAPAKYEPEHSVTAHADGKKTERIHPRGTEPI